MADEMVEKSSKATSRRWKEPKQARSLARVNRILDVAENLFVEVGYAVTTTKQIATQAEVPIGSLYQFFPDKAAILEALAERYTHLLNERLQAFDTPEMLQLPLADYVGLMTEGIDCFFSEYPGYRAVFMEITTLMPEVDAAGDAQLIKTSEKLLMQRNASLKQEDYEAIAFVLIKAMGNLLWISSGQSPKFRQRLVSETKQLTLNYLKSYFPERACDAEGVA